MTSAMQLYSRLFWSAQDARMPFSDDPKFLLVRRRRAESSHARRPVCVLLTSVQIRAKEMTKILLPSIACIRSKSPVLLGRMLLHGRHSYTGRVAYPPLRRRLLEDMNDRKLCASTQRGHIYSCKWFAALLKRSSAWPC
jgi:hypothetical protein